MTDEVRPEQTPTIAVRQLTAIDTAPAAALHEQLAAIQFIARGGPRLICAYYRAWIDTDHALALGAFDLNNQLIGVLLGTLDSAAHYNQMLRRHGVQLATALLVAATIHPSFGRELVTTRVRRYARGVALFAKRSKSKSTGRTELPTGNVATAERVAGEVTHLIVDGRRRSAGTGRALLEAAARTASECGLPCLELVAIPESDAAAFYEHLGWCPKDTVISHSGEYFVRYQLQLDR